MSHAYSCMCNSILPWTVYHWCPCVYNLKCVLCLLMHQMLTDHCLTWQSKKCFLNFLLEEWLSGSLLFLCLSSSNSNKRGSFTISFTHQKATWPLLVFCSSNRTSRFHWLVSALRIEVSKSVKLTVVEICLKWKCAHSWILMTHDWELLLKASGQFSL